MQLWSLPSRHVDEDDGCKRTALTVALELVLRALRCPYGLTSRTAIAGLLARAIPSSFTVRLGQHVRDAARPRDCDEGSWPSSGAPTERASRSPTRRTTAASSDRPDLYCPSLQSPPRAASCSARSLVLRALDGLGTQNSSARPTVTAHRAQVAGRGAPGLTPMALLSAVASRPTSLPLKATSAQRPAPPTGVSSGNAS